MTSIATAAEQLSTFVSTQIARDDELRNWAAGTPTGGPLGDGYYPLTDSLGVTLPIPSVAKLTSLLTGPSIQASLTLAADSANSAALASSAAEATREAAAAVLVQTTAKAAEAASARDNAANSAAAAAFSAATIADLLVTITALAERIRVLETSGTPPPVITFAPSLDFSDARNSQYL